MSFLKTSLAFTAASFLTFPLPTLGANPCPELKGHYLGCVQKGQVRELESSEIEIDEIRTHDETTYATGKKKLPAAVGRSRPSDGWVNLFAITGFATSFCKDGELRIDQLDRRQTIRREGRKILVRLEKRVGPDSYKTLGSYTCEQVSPPDNDHPTGPKGKGSSTPAA